MVTTHARNAMMDLQAIVLAVLGILGAMCAAVAWIAKYSLTRLSNDLKEHTKAAIRQIEATNKQTKSNENTAKATQSFEKYLRERNGRDGEVHKYLLSAMAKLPGDMRLIASDSVKDIKLAMQNVHVQKVDTQVIKEATVGGPKDG